MANTKTSGKKSVKSAGTSRTKKAKSSGAKNSLVGNINKRKKAGTSRSKQSSTISKKAYDHMRKGWPKKAPKKRAKK